MKKYHTSEQSKKRSIVQKRYYEKNKLQLKNKRAERNSKYPEGLKRYKLTVEGFDQLLNTQEKKCSICEEFFSKEKRPEVDHCHKTGKVRSLLCHRCNVGLGVIESDFFEKAQEYLSSYK